MYASFDPKNLLHWLSFFLALSGVLTFVIAWRKFRLQYRKPKIDIYEISAEPTIDDKWGDRESDCFIRFYVFNASSFGNHISGKLQRFHFLPSLESKIYLLAGGPQLGDYLMLPKFDKILVTMLPRYEDVEKYKSKHLLLTIKDVRGNKTRKWFKFKDFNVS